MMNLHTSSAFSLVGIAVIITVLSLATGLGLALTDTRLTRQAHFDTVKQLQKVEAALNHFFDTYGRLPCPASRTAKLGDAGFGEEILGGGCSTDFTQPAGTNRFALVRIGSLPTRTLMLRDDMMLDAYENRITYAVTEALTSSASYGGASGAVTVNDGSGTNLTTTAAFVLISHGDDARGAHSRFGVANKTTCTGSTPAVENCDNDNIFTRAAFDLDKSSATYFDDLVLWQAKY